MSRSSTVLNNNKNNTNAISLNHNHHYKSDAYEDEYSEVNTLADCISQCFEVSGSSRSDDQKQYETRLNNLLPITIGGLQIRRLSWNEFQGKPDASMCYWAHIYWNINFSYQIASRNENHGYFQYKVKNISVNVKVQSKSWVRKQNDYLLSHEQGHYLIGCLCALEFKQQVLRKKYSANYAQEIQQLFDDTLQYYSKMEVKYDIETNHAKQAEKQTQWFQFLHDALIKQQQAFDNKIKQTQKVISSQDSNENNANKENIEQNNNNNNNTSNNEKGNKLKTIPDNYYFKKGTNIVKTIERSNSNNDNNCNNSNSGKENNQSTNNTHNQQRRIHLPPTPQSNSRKLSINTTNGSGNGIQRNIITSGAAVSTPTTRNHSRNSTDSSASTASASSQSSSSLNNNGQTHRQSFQDDHPILLSKPPLLRIPNSTRTNNNQHRFVLPPLPKNIQNIDSTKPQNSRTPARRQDSARSNSQNGQIPWQN